MPIKKFNEVNTWPIIEEIRKKDGPLIVVSKSDLENITLQSFILEEDHQSQLKDNAWGISEPRTGEEVNPNELDLILVPLIIFDRQGYRIGYGKGFYDKFLAQCRKDAIKVGLSVFEPVNKIEDIEKFDIPLDYCVTPVKLYQF